MNELKKMFKDCCTDDIGRYSTANTFSVVMYSLLTIITLVEFILYCVKGISWPHYEVFIMVTGGSGTVVKYGSQRTNIAMQKSTIDRGNGG